MLTVRLHYCQKLPLFLHLAKILTTEFDLLDSQTSSVPVK